MAKAKAKASTTAAPAGGKFTRKRAVTLPTFKVEVDKTLYLMVNSAMYLGKEQKAKAGEEAKKGAAKMDQPATILPVTDVETGEQGQIIVNAVLKGILDETYPDESYVGKSFEITKHDKKAGKRYHTFSVFEIDPS